MNQKELPSRVRPLARWVFAKRRMAGALLIFLGLMWAVPMGLKWWLVQQLQHALKREVTVQAVHVNPLSLSFDIQDLSIKNTHGGEFVGWQRLTLKASAQSLRERALVLDAVTLQGPRVSAVHLGQGRFDFSDLLDGPQQSNSTALPKFVLRELSIQDGQVALEDRPHQRTHTFQNFNLTLPGVSSLAGKNGLTLRPELSVIVNGAPVHLGGSVQPLADAPEGALAFTLNALDLAGLQAYVPASLPLRLARGKLSADLKLQFSEHAGQMALMLTGTTRVQDFVLNDARDHALLSFKTLALSLSQSDVLARHLVFSDVMLDDPKVSVRINRTGQMNWRAVQPPAQPPTATTAPSATTESPALALQVNQLKVRGGVVDFADASVQPVVQTRLSDVNAVLRGFSTQPNTQADVSLKGHVGLAAPLEVQARLQPMALTTFLDAALHVKNVELTRFSGYARKYVGYALDKGKLSMDATYRINHHQLQADNHVFIDQLTLGEQVASSDAINAPVSMGVSLLKNSDGQIDIDLPMSGALDAPEFSFGALVGQTLGNALVKVVSAPFRFFGDLFGGEDLSYVGFAPNSFALDDAAKQKLSALTRALKSRESLALEVRGIFDTARDTAVQRKTLCEGGTVTSAVLDSLASCRSQAVAKWLMEVGQIQPERVFLLESHSREGGTPAEAGVSFSLR